jgi:uncharacterized protein YndB with AHSA1/START domain
MKNLQFDFTVDKIAGTVLIEKEFDCELSLVWDAFTTKEILDKWWAPKPLESKTIVMEFKVGGRRFYAMVSQEGKEVGYQLQNYTSISPKTNFKYTSFFADKDENPVLPGSHWDLTFSEQHGITKVSILIKNDSLERLQKMIEMGFKEALTMTINYLEQILVANK